MCCLIPDELQQNYLNPVALARIGWKYYIVIDVIIALALITVFFTFPETSQITLEEVSLIFDGKHAVSNDLVDKTEDKKNFEMAEHHDVAE